MAFEVIFLRFYLAFMQVLAASASGRHPSSKHGTVIAIDEALALIASIMPWSQRMLEADEIIPT